MGHRQNDSRGVAKSTLTYLAPTSPLLLPPTIALPALILFFGSVRLGRFAREIRAAITIQTLVRRRIAWNRVDERRFERSKCDRPL